MRVSGFGQTGPYAQAPGLRHARRGHVGLRLAQWLRGSRARAAAARHGRHDRGAVRRHGHRHRGAQRRGQRRPRPGHRRQPARVDLLDPRPRGRHPQAHAARSASAWAARSEAHVAPQRVRHEGRRLGGHLRVDPGHDGAAVPRHRPRRPQPEPERSRPMPSASSAARRSTRSSAGSSRSGRWPTPSRSSRRPRSRRRRSTTSASSSTTRTCRSAASSSRRRTTRWARCPCTRSCRASSGTPGRLRSPAPGDRPAQRRDLRAHRLLRASASPRSRRKGSSERWPCPAPGARR